MELSVFSPTIFSCTSLPRGSGRGWTGQEDRERWVERITRGVGGRPLLFRCPLTRNLGDRGPREVVRSLDPRPIEVSGPKETNINHSVNPPLSPGTFFSGREVLSISPIGFLTTTPFVYPKRLFFLGLLEPVLLLSTTLYLTYPSTIGGKTLSTKYRGGLRSSLPHVGFRPYPFLASLPWEVSAGRLSWSLVLGGPGRVGTPVNSPIISSLTSPE